MRSLLLLVLLVAGLGAADPAAAPSHVVVLVIDGPRWSETWGRPGRDLIPEREALRPQGVFFADFSNTGHTVTEAGHIAITTGFLQATANNGTDLPKQPSWLQRHLAASFAVPTDAWIIASKDKLAMLADTSHREWRGRFLPSQDAGGARGVGTGFRDDGQTLARAKEVIAAHRPRALLVHFKSPDVEGHGGNWEQYLEAIRRTDRQAGELWRAIQADPVMGGRTALFITNDHGRHTDEPLAPGAWTGHGDTCRGCRHIELLALGPGFAAGREVVEPYEQRDLAVTCARLLGVDIPGSEGRPLPLAP